MKAWFIAGAGLLLMGGAGIAVAQTPASPPAVPPPPAAQNQVQPPPPPGARPADDGMRGPQGGPMGRGMGGGFGRHGGEMGGWGHPHRMDGPMPPPPPPGAHFRLRREGSLIDIRCAENEPMKACVDAATALLDKAAATR